jgi:3-hydroxybutyryl-CoA dehydrogenase
MQDTAVIGAGTMGHGIAYSLLTGGYRVVLVDSSEAALEKARGTIRSLLADAAGRGLLSPDRAEAASAALTTSTALESVQRAELVIEAVPEDLALKHAVLSAVDRICQGRPILATNTSALSITEIATATQDPTRVVGMHYFNPVHKMKLVEIIRGLETGREAVETALAVAARCGKETVVVNEAPGFATSRISALIGNEAFYMLMEGVASARDIDKAVRLGLNHPMGPFEVADLVGLDTRLRVLEHLHATLGEKFRPCPLLVKYVKAGRLGRKVGRGVYDYSHAGGAETDAKNRTASSPSSS